MPALKIGSRPPWVGLAAAVWVQIAAGNTYNFPLYSYSLKSVMGISQQQLTVLGVANDIGENFGLIPGLVSNKLPPWIMLLIGSLSCFLGYGVLWLVVSQTLPSIPYWLLWLALVVATNSSAWFGTAVLVTNMRNFPLSRGTVAGILKGYVGLSAAVYTEVYTDIFNNSSTKLLLFLTLGIPVICLILMFLVRPCTPASEDDSTAHGYFIFTQAISFILGIYLLTTTILSNTFQLGPVFSYVFICIMIVILLAPLGIPAKMTLYPHTKRSWMLKQSTSREYLPTEDQNSEKSEPLMSGSSSLANIEGDEDGADSVDVFVLLAEGEWAFKKRRPRRGEDFKFSEAVIKADFWLLFLVYFVGVGSGVTVLNNLAQIGIALGVSDTTVLLSLFSFCNFLGRLGGGAVSEYFVRSKRLPRTIWMTCTQSLMIVTYLLFASGINGTLYASTALLGICFGTQFSVMISTASELFGLKHFGIIYNFMTLGNPLGAFLFSAMLAGYVYDEVAQSQVGGLLGTSATCLGPNCFRITFLVLAALSFMGTVLSIVLTWRIKSVYQMLYCGGSFRGPSSSDNC